MSTEKHQEPYHNLKWIKGSEEQKAIDDMKKVLEKNTIQWAEKILEDKGHWNQEKQSLIDEIVYGKSMTHIDEEGNAERVIPGSEKWNEVEIALNQSYEQYINPPDEELHKRAEEMKEALKERLKRDIVLREELEGWTKKANESKQEEQMKEMKKATQMFNIPTYEDNNYLLKVRIKELEEQIVTYCRENPSAEEWFQITVKRDADGRE